MVATLVIWVAAFVLIGVFLLSAGTVGLAVRHQRSDRCRDEVTRSVRRELFDRFGRADPEWEAWVASLDAVERRALRSLLDRYLRTISGQERGSFLVLARAMGLRRRAIDSLQDGSVSERLRALAWLALLDRRVPARLLRTHCTDHRRLREAAASVVLAHREAYTDGDALGTELLIHDGQEVLTVYGLETLARLNERGSTPLLERGADAAESWRADFLVQVLTVLSECQLTDPDEALEWVLPLLRHDDATVRATAVSVFEQAGWRRGLRDRLPIEAVTDDPAPAVRRWAFDLLAAWGDRRSRERLLEAAQQEPDERTRLSAYRAFLALADNDTVDEAAVDDPLWAWARRDDQDQDVGTVLSWSETTVPSPPSLELDPTDTVTGETDE